MKRFTLPLTLAVAALIVVSLHSQQVKKSSPESSDRMIHENAERVAAQGRQVFRFDTFGDEDFWGGTLGLHKAIEGAKFGGVGSGVSPIEPLR